MQAFNRIKRSSASSSSNEEKSDHIGLPIESSNEIEEIESPAIQNVGISQQIESSNSTIQIVDTNSNLIISDIGRPDSAESDHDQDIDLLNILNSDLSSQITNPNVGILDAQNIIRPMLRQASAPFGGRRFNSNTVTTNLQPSQVVELSTQEQADYFMAKALELADKARAEKALWGEQSSSNSNAFSSARLNDANFGIHPIPTTTFG